MARTQSLSIGLVFLLGCVSAPKAQQAPPKEQQDVARPEQAAPQAAPAETKVFKSPDGDFQLQYPASWELGPNSPDYKFRARAFFDTVSAIVSAEQVPPGTTLDAFVDGLLGQLKNTTGTEVKSRIERTTMTLGGSPAVRLGGVVNVSDVDLHFDMIVAFVNRKGYALTCTSVNTAAATMKPVFDRIIGSMRFTK